MRHRDRVLQSLEGVYREAFRVAQERGDQPEMTRLDTEYQRDQIHLEVLLDIRDLLSAPPQEPKEEKGSSLLEHAQALRRLTRLR